MPSSPYAKRTKVGERQSRSDIEHELEKHDCERVAVMTEPTGVWFGFQKGQRCYRVGITLPTDNDAERRRKLRTLFLYLKGRLNGVRDGVKSFEAEFMPETVMGDGMTMAEHALPQLKQIEDSGRGPTRLALPGGSP